MRFHSKMNSVITLTAFILSQSYLHIHGSEMVFTKLSDVTDKTCPGVSELVTATDIHKKTQCASLCLQDSRCGAFVVNEVSGKCQLLTHSTRLTASCTGETGTLHYGKLQAGCPSGYSWYEGARMCYKIGTSCGTWNYGRTQCQQEGTDLLILSDPDFWTFFRNFLLNSFTVQCGGVWVGASDEATEGSWVWVDGSPAGTVDWGQNQPSGGTRENCMDILSLVGYRANDAPCGYNGKHFACGIAM